MSCSKQSSTPNLRLSNYDYGYQLDGSRVAATKKNVVLRAGGLWIVAMGASGNRSNPSVILICPDTGKRVRVRMGELRPVCMADFRYCWCPSHQKYRQYKCWSAWYMKQMRERYNRRVRDPTWDDIRRYVAAQ